MFHTYTHLRLSRAQPWLANPAEFERPLTRLLLLPKARKSYGNMHCFVQNVAATLLRKHAPLTAPSPPAPSKRNEEKAPAHHQRELQASERKRKHLHTTNVSSKQATEPSVSALHLPHQVKHERRVQNHDHAADSKQPKHTRANTQWLQKAPSQTKLNRSAAKALAWALAHPLCYHCVCTGCQYVQINGG